MLQDPKWPTFWKKFINAQVLKFQFDTSQKKHPMKEGGEALLLIEGVIRSENGIDKFEAVKTREKMQVWFDEFYCESCILCATN